MAIKRLLPIANPDTLEEHRAFKILQLQAVYQAKAVSPVVASSLGYNIDAGYDNLTDFGIGQELGLLQIRDADNLMHSITDADYTVIIQEIKVNGLTIKQNKWVHEAVIGSLTSIDDIRSYDITTGWPS